MSPSSGALLLPLHLYIPVYSNTLMCMRLPCMHGGVVEHWHACVCMGSGEYSPDINVLEFLKGPEDSRDVGMCDVRAFFPSENDSAVEWNMHYN